MKLKLVAIREIINISCINIRFNGNLDLKLFSSDFSRQGLEYSDIESNCSLAKSKEVELISSAEVTTKCCN